MNEYNELFPSLEIFSSNNPITVFIVRLNASPSIRAAKSAAHCAARFRVPDLPCSRCLNSAL